MDGRKQRGRIFVIVCGSGEAIKLRSQFWERRGVFLHPFYYHPKALTAKDAEKCSRALRKPVAQSVVLEIPRGAGGGGEGTKGPSTARRCASLPAASLRMTELGALIRTLESVLETNADCLTLIDLRICRT